MARVQQKRSLGKMLVFGGLGVALLSPSLADPTNPGKAVYTAMAGAAVSSVGLYLRYNSNPSDGFWQNSVGRIKEGQTTADEIRQCFGSPSSTISSSQEQTWTYNATKMGLLGMSGSSRSVSVSLRDGLVTKIQKSEFGF